MSVVTAPNTSSAHVVLAGEIDMTASAALSEAAARVAATAATTVVVDLAQVMFASATLLTFVAGLHHGLPAGSTISLCRPRGTTRRILLIAGMDRIATLQADLPAPAPSAHESYPCR